MVRLVELRLVRIGNSKGVIIPIEQIKEFEKNGMKSIWIAILSKEESPSSKGLLNWIKKRE